MYNCSNLLSKYKCPRKHEQEVVPASPGERHRDGGRQTGAGRRHGTLPYTDHAYWSATEPARWCPVVCCIALPGGTWELVPSAPKHLSLIGSWSISLLVNFVSFTAGLHCSPFVLSPPPALLMCPLFSVAVVAGWLASYACSTLKFGSWLVCLSSSSSCQGGRKRRRCPLKKEMEKGLYALVDFYILHC